MAWSNKIHTGAKALQTRKLLNEQHDFLLSSSSSAGRLNQSCVTFSLQFNFWTKRQHFTLSSVPTHRFFTTLKWSHKALWMFWTAWIYLSTSVLKFYHGKGSLDGNRHLYNHNNVRAIFGRLYRQFLAVIERWVVTTLFAECRFSSVLWPLADVWQITCSFNNSRLLSACWSWRCNSSCNEKDLRNALRI